MSNFKIGIVTHYYDKIKVAVIDLTSDLAPGDVIKFMRGGEDLFEQKIESVQIEHEKVKSARKGDCVGIKVDEPVKEGAEVFRIL